MRTEAHRPGLSALCYLDASKVTSPAGVLSELPLLSADGKRLGSIEGVVIEAAARRVRYFEVQLTGWFRHRRCVLEADQLAQVEPDGKALRLCVNVKGKEVADLDPATLRDFSDDDLLLAMFPPRVTT